MPETADKAANTSAVATKPKLTNRGVAQITLVVVGGAAAVGLFALLGPWAAAAVPVAAASGGYVQHRMKNTKKRSTGRQKKGWSLTWGKTGGRSLPALSRIGSGSKKSAGGATGRTGAKSRFSRLPASGPMLKKALAGSRSRTTHSRAAAGAGGVLPKHKARRSVPSRTSAKPAPFAGARPRGTKPPKTASKTAARPATSQRLTGPKRGASTSQKGSTPARGSTSRRPNLRLLQGGKSSAQRRSGSPSLTKKATPSANRKTSPISRRLSSARRMMSPFRTSPSGKHSRLKSPFRRTKSTLPSRRSSKLASRRDRIPFRTAKRPIPYKRTRAKTLWRLALGIPSRKGNKLVGISAAKRARARRTLRLRTLTRLFAVRRFPGFLSRLPGRFGRWHWDRIWNRIPAVPKPEHEWLTAAPRPKAVVAPGPRHAVPAPSPTRNEAPSVSSTPQQMIIEAFNQLAAFRTESASEMERHLSADSEMWQQVGQSIVAFADSVQTTMPYGPATCDGLRDLGAAAMAIGQMSQQVHQTFRSEHEVEINRIEAPRADEGQWDIGRQG